MTARLLAVQVLATALLAAAGPVPAGAVSTGAVPVGTVSAVPGPPLPVVAAGAFTWPLAGAGTAGPPDGAGSPGAVTRRFLPPPHPYGRGHRGADLGAGPGATVFAAGAGTVVFAGTLAGRGVVSVRHAGGLRTTYEPVRATVAPGTVVARGAPIGSLEPGHRGCPVPACLHWGLRRAVPGASGPEQYLDPLLLVGLGRARLLPWEALGSTKGEPGWRTRPASGPAPPLASAGTGPGGGLSRPRAPPAGSAGA